MEVGTLTKSDWNISHMKWQILPMSYSHACGCMFNCSFLYNPVGTAHLARLHNYFMRIILVLHWGQEIRQQRKEPATCRLQVSPHGGVPVGRSFLRIPRASECGQNLFPFPFNLHSLPDSSPFSVCLSFHSSPPHHHHTSLEMVFTADTVLNSNHPSLHCALCKDWHIKY